MSKELKVDSPIRKFATFNWRNVSMIPFVVSVRRSHLWRRTMNTIKVCSEFILRYILSRRLAKTLRTNGVQVSTSLAAKFQFRCVEAFIRTGLSYMLLIICTLTTLDARNLLPSIDRIRKKVENTVNTQSDNFRDILAKAGITNNVVSGHHILRGEQISATKELSLADVEKALNDLYWSNQKEFVDALTQQMKQSEAQAMILLKQKIKEKYSTEKTPIIFYAQTLANEEKQLDDLFQAWLRLSNTSNMVTKDKKQHIKKLKQLYERHTQLKQTLENLIKTTNALIS
jgi:hypothetical protein